MGKTSIEWTEATWNPVTGCSPVSAGCAHCYAKRMALRLQAMGHPNYSAGFDVRCHRHMLAKPLQWLRPTTVFVNSMSDLFHEDVPLTFLRSVFDTMGRAGWHTFQVLTKRSERLRDLAPLLDWPVNVWMGVSVESPDYTYRVDHLREVGATVRFVSFEPLLDCIPHVDLRGVDWVIVGGESGPGARPLRPEWVLSIRDQCRAARVPFFFKQWGGASRKKSGRMLHGRTYDEMPMVDLGTAGALRVAEATSAYSTGE